MSRAVTETWAFVRPDGSILADGFATVAEAWKIGLGWPDAAEIVGAQREGYKVVRARIELLEEAV